MKRVSKNDKNDWKKLKRCLGFLKRTIKDRRIMSADNLTDLYVWIDTSHAVHDNMQEHTGGVISMGRGALHCKSSAQKINTKSTTESELVGVSEYLPYYIWFLLFFEAQGYEIKKNMLYQDNESAIKMEINGRNSCTGNSRHIEIKCFWVKDRVDRKEVNVRYCPTALMLADYFTKPLQEALFKKFRSIIMGYTHIDEIILNPLFSIKERIENVIENNELCHERKTSQRQESKSPTYADIVTNGRQIKDRNQRVPRILKSLKVR